MASLAKPGGNTTGISILATELDGKRQEILAEVVPGIRRMAQTMRSTLALTIADAWSASSSTRSPKP